jgi:uncharacterized protein with PIN domain
VATVRACFRFHGELNELLAPSRRDREFAQTAGGTDTLKHVIESLGVPHTEVGRVTVNGVEAPLTAAVHDSDSVQVWPFVPSVSLAEPRFVLDGHLGRLAAYLRMLGFDVRYDRYADDSVLARIAAEEGRVLLTRDTGLLKRKEVAMGRLVRAHHPQDQLLDIMTRYGLSGRARPFTRCMACNGPLLEVSKSQVEHLLPPHTKLTKTAFKRCGDCSKIYWQGSHHEAMLRRIDALAPG